eukprot:Nitzschia sp. Nitz4//scaffold93_size78505//26//1436//NITZ4_005408-RA/size78505-snap-gene-0.0-mRNA-1//1//CDS//3329560252//934//frame0
MENPDTLVVAKRQLAVTQCWRATIVLLGLAAVASSLMAIFSCQFFTYKSLDGEPWLDLTPPFENLTEASVGLFQYSESVTSSDNVFFGDSCVLYDDWVDVGQTKYFYVAQWTSMVAPGAGILAVLQILFELCCCRLRDAASQNKCQLLIGGWYSIGSSGMYLLLAILTVGMQPYLDKRANFCCIWTRNCRRSKYDSDDEKATHNKSEDSDEEAGFKDIPDYCKEDVDFSKLNQKDSDDSWEKPNNNMFVVPVIAPSTSDVNSDVGLNVHEEDEHAIVKEMDLHEQETVAAAQNKSQLPISEKTEAVVVSSSPDPNVGPLALVSGGLSIDSPDFLDTMCCADPTEIEMYKKEAANYEKKTKSTSRRMAPSTVGPQPTADKPDPKLGVVL